MSNTIRDVLAGRERWCLIRGDCRTVLPRLPDRGVAHVITDPPYRRSLYEGFRTNSDVRSSNRQPGGKRVPSTAYMQLASEKIGALDDVLETCSVEFLRTVRRWMIVFHDAESGHLWREQLGPGYVRAGIWLKTNPVPQISGDRPGQAFEAITIGHQPGRMRWNAGGKAGDWRTVWEHTALQGNRTERRDNPHPCPKPLSLMRELVEDFTDPDDVVLDPFAGSGTTGVACLELGRRFIGIERDGRFARAATRRLTRAAASSGRPEVVISGRAA